MFGWMAGEDFESTAGIDEAGDNGGEGRHAASTEQEEEDSVLTRSMNRVPSFFGIDVDATRAKEVAATAEGRGGGGEKEEGETAGAGGGFFF
jgi:hypothetical protein